ncbi:hypothetical protein BDZ85DRAFT_83548 [Elsinoe ampelina]|uniref:Uncharacterized protein n=1 Tax=Elsinoe ampelina TaxID=302913 RepID=A0A6A6GG93_9PEZI|nr:hypothetical protein BDZ85DRAFT_83548 [Elsinoe ampelina]
MAMPSSDEYHAPIDSPAVQDLISRVRSQLDVVAEPEARSTLKEAVKLVIRLSLRLLPREGTSASQKEHIDNGTAKKLLISLEEIGEQLLVDAAAALRQTSEPLEKTFLLNERIAQGSKAMLGDWRTIMSGLSLPISGLTKTIRLTGALYNLALLQPALELLDGNPNHLLSTLKVFITDAAHILTHAAFIYRQSDKNRRFIFKSLTSCTTSKERTLILKSSSGSSSSDSPSSASSLMPRSAATSDPPTATALTRPYPNPATPLLSTSRSMSFSSNIKVPESITEARCEQYSSAGHECEAEGCTMLSSPFSLSTTALDDIALLDSDLASDGWEWTVETQDVTIEEKVDDEDALMMKPSPIQVRKRAKDSGSKDDKKSKSIEKETQTQPTQDLLTGSFEGTTEVLVEVRHERMKSLQQLSGESPSGPKGKKLQRVWSLPVGTVLGSVPERKRRQTEGAMSRATDFAEANKSLPALPTSSKVELPQRTSTF